MPNLDDELMQVGADLNNNPFTTILKGYGWNYSFHIDESTSDSNPGSSVIAQFYRHDGPLGCSMNFEVPFSTEPERMKEYIFSLNNLMTSMRQDNAFSASKCMDSVLQNNIMEFEAKSNGYDISVTMDFRDSSELMDMSVKDIENRLPGIMMDVRDSFQKAVDHLFAWTNREVMYEYESEHNADSNLPKYTQDVVLKCGPDYYVQLDYEHTKDNVGADVMGPYSSPEVAQWAIFDNAVQSRKVIDKAEENLDIKSMVLDKIKDNSMISDNHGQLEMEIIPDYRDRMPDEFVKNILNSSDPWLEFENCMTALYEDTEINMVDDIIESVKNSLEVEQWAIGNEDFFIDEEDIEDIFYDNVHRIYPDDFMKEQNYQVDIFIDTGDANFDFSSNIDFFKNLDDPEAFYNSSVVWLAKQQGYSDKEIMDEFKKELDIDIKPKNVLERLHWEVEESPSDLETLTVLASMSLKDMIDLNVKMDPQQKDYHYNRNSRPDCGTITIDKNASVGLYNMWSGAGSIFEVELDKDIKLPVNLIYSARPDFCEGQWTIENVYGMPKSEWKENIVTINNDERVVSNKLNKAKEQADLNASKGKTDKKKTVDINKDAR